MSATIELFEQYKQSIGVHADRLAAQALGVKSKTVSNWRTRGSQAEPWLIEKMCETLGHDATPWLIRALAEQATGPHNRKVWMRVGKGLGYKIAGVVTLLGAHVALLSRLANGEFQGVTNTALNLQQVFDFMGSAFAG
ncbi:hypothetical protein CS053_00760 [Rhodanobacter glycinis]|uniref:Bacteriophage CI repressor helix-turn-helix domain-containing protein n=1 Tax=Rhodanobacter glycinis TaxID=582702 RepID=A0A5B9DVG4_9GAMM|nr:hypothetical protein [Rhodanobacter glycinis]QEE23188.1 hypothetical protein CS053_00760 [Rhodanobacter glycinis]